MKFNFKKISAVITSGLMVVSGAAMAAAANFPAPFSDGSAANTAIVYGANAASTDVAAVTNINEYLKTKVTSEGGAPTGESFAIAKPSTKLDVGSNTTYVWGSAVTKADLPTLLADGNFYNRQNTQYAYTQKIDLGTMSFTHFSDIDYLDKTPTLGFKLGSNTGVFNYTLNFVTSPESSYQSTSSADLSDFENKNIQILGRNYYILDFKNTTKITFLDSATSSSVAMGETKTVSLNGKSYDVTPYYIGTNEVILTVNGVQTEKLSDTGTTYGNTYKLSDGTYVGIKTINYNAYSGGTQNVEFSLGSGKLEVNNNANVKINDKQVDDLYSFVTLGYNTGSAKRTWQKMVLEWKISDKQFLTPGKELVMPGFEAVKFTMSDTTIPKKESTRVDGGDTYATLKATIKDGEVSIPFLWVNETTGNITGIGQSATQRLSTSNSTELVFTYLKGTTAVTSGDSYDQGFVASWASARDYESYYLKATVRTDSTAGRNYTTIQKKSGGSWTVVCEDLSAEDTSTCSAGLGSVTLTIQNVYYNSTDKWVNMTINSGGSFNKLYTNDGLLVYLPYADLRSGNVALSYNKGALNLNATANATYVNDGYQVGRWTMWYGEADQYGALDTYPFNMTIDGSGGTAGAKKATVLNVDLKGAAFLETSSGSKMWESYMASPLATKVNWDKTDTNFYVANVEYHGGEVYANVFVTAPTSTMGEVGNMIFTDAEKASWQGRNVVLVGGSCINSATAELLGGPYCESEFSANSGGVSAGQFMIASYADKFTTGKTALVVAGYNAADTTAAAAYLLEKTVDTTAGKKYVGTVSATGTVDVTAL